MNESLLHVRGLGVERLSCGPSLSGKCPSAVPEQGTGDILQRSLSHTHLAVCGFTFLEQPWSTGTTCQQCCEAGEVVMARQSPGGYIPSSGFLLAPCASHPFRLGPLTQGLPCGPQWSSCAQSSRGGGSQALAGHSSHCTTWASSPVVPVIQALFWPHRYHPPL